MAEAETPLDARILTILRQLPSGDVVRLPVAEPKLASIGSRTGTLEEQLTFLAEHLSALAPAPLARFLSPPGAELHTVDVELGREDLPRRLAIPSPVSVRVVLVPAQEPRGRGTEEPRGRGTAEEPRPTPNPVVGVPKTRTPARWAFIPKLSTVIYLTEDEPLDEALRAEITRLVAADDPSPTEWLSLLPAPAESLEILTVPIDRKERGPSGRSASLHKKLIEAAKDREAIEILRSIGTALHARFDDPAFAPELVARQAELLTLTALLAAPARQSVLLVGRERVGKSALLLGWLQAEKKAGRPRLAFATSGAQLIAGMSGLGQWQERLRRVLEAAHRLDAVMVFEDLGDLFGDNAGGGHIDLAGTIRPWIQESKVRLVAELTPEALGLFEPRDVGFFSNLARVRVEPLDAESTRRALETRASLPSPVHGAPQPGGTAIVPAAITTILDLADRYQPYQPLPGKAIGLYEEVATRAEERRDSHGHLAPITPEDVLEAFSVTSGIPVFLLREDRALYREQVAQIFRQRLIGQDEAIRRVIDTICVVKAGLQPTGKPLATFLFVGPTGVGKTELARTLATFLFGAADRLMRFDMSEFADPLAAERLFRGTHGSEGLLTRQIRQQPFSVLLLDEIEKAHGGVFDLLLQITGEGRLTDARGRTAYFHNTIVIMTSNLGAAHRKNTVGIGGGAVEDEAYYLREVERTFRPELVNRLDRVIAFAPLTAAEVEQVAHIAVARLGVRRGFSERGVTLAVSPAALAALARTGYSAHYGARALRRELEDALVAPAARAVNHLAGAARAQRHLHVTLREEPPVKGALSASERGDLRFQMVSGARSGKPSTFAPAAAIARMRSEATRARALDRVTHVSESLETLVAQLAQANKSKDVRHGVDVAQLQRDHHRLSTLWSNAERPYQELLAAEELAMSAYLTDGDPRDTLEVAERALDTFRRALALVLLADQSTGDHVMVRVRELDDGHPLVPWLDAFFAGAQARGWTVQVHLDGDRKDGVSWPAGRYFGPPRTPPEARERLEARHGGRGDVLLAVQGPWCAALLGLESGLHRITGWSGKSETTHLLVRSIAARHEFTDAEWTTLLGHEPLDPKTDHGKRPAIRHLDARRDTLYYPGGNSPCRRNYSTYWRDLELVAYFVSVALAREADS